MVLRLQDISKSFRVRKAGSWEQLHAVQKVSLQVTPGKVHAIVGESGSGKSTLARTAIRLYNADEGRIFWGDQDITDLPEHKLRPLRGHIQMVFQDPYSSLNPRQKIATALMEPLIVHKIGSPQDRQERCVHMLERVGLSGDILSKYPHEFSGGQRQRICIARALMLKPKIVIADEAVSALDVSIQAQILALMQDLQKEFNLAYLFITHDLEVVKLIADTITVMQHGKVVEESETEALFNNPTTTYTQRLLDSRPTAHLTH